MTQFLPPNLLALFAPRDPAPYLPPTDKLSHEKRRPPYLGVAQYLGLFEDPKDTPPPTRAETREERRERKRREKAEQVTYKLEQEIAKWEPTNNPASTTDAFKTLFVARINYDTSESKLRREFEAYGAIRKIILVSDEKSRKPRGYAFIEYEHERDMHSAYKHADGKKIDGKRVLVDVERARTVKGWLPRRLGGGLGGTRRGGPEVNVKHSGREDNERERDRYLEREKVKERERERELESTTPRGKRRSRSPRRDHGDRDKEREKDRKHRSKSRERKRKRSRSRDRDGERDRGRDKDKDKDRERDKESRPDKEPRPDKDRKRSRRSRSRDGDRKKDRREKDRDRRDSGRPGREEQVRIKEEPMDEYPEYNGDGGYQYDPNAVKYEETDPNAEYEFQPENY